MTLPCLPHGVTVHPSGNFVYVTNSVSNGGLTVIDAASNKIVKTVKTGSSTYGVAVHPSGKSVYVTNYKRRTLSVIDTATNTVTATVPAGSKPDGVAITPKSDAQSTPGSR